jgi:hypothetical protein
MLAIYGLLFILNVVVLAKLRVCTIGQVQDEVTGEGLGGVSFRVYKDDKQVDLTLTNNQGEVKLNIKEGDYKAILNKRGYLGAVTEGKPIKVKTKASVKSKGEVSPVISVRIKKSGRLSENILMRRRSDEKFFTKSMLKKSINKGAAENGDTLASPFS